MDRDREPRGAASAHLSRRDECEHAEQPTAVTGASTLKRSTNGVCNRVPLSWKSYVLLNGPATGTSRACTKTDGLYGGSEMNSNCRYRFVNQ
jgi:hypothetical protein